MKRYRMHALRAAALLALLAAAGPLATLRAQSQQVALGQFGGAVLLVGNPTAGYTLNGQPVQTGSTVTGSNGLRYVLTVSGPRPTARYLPRLVSVALGTAGGTVTFSQRENGEYWWGGARVASGETVVAADGRTYRLTLQNRAWTAAVTTAARTVALGQSGEVITLTPVAGGGFSFQGTVVREGRRVTDTAGNVYQLTLRNGVWQAEPVTTPNPDPNPGGAGSGNVPVSDYVGSYVGARPVLRTGDSGERRSLLVIAGSEFPVQQLFADEGYRDTATFAERAADRIDAVRGEIDALLDVLGTSTSAARRAVQARWDVAQDALDDFFGSSRAIGILGTVPERRGGEIDAAEIEYILDEVLVALGSFADFRDAVRSGGIFEGAVDVADADDAFDAVFSTETFAAGSTTNTRFGVYAVQGRDGARSWTEGLSFLSGATRYDTFAYSPLEPARQVDLPLSGEARYSGETVAIAPSDPTIRYRGDFELNVRFSSNRVNGLVRDLRDERGRAWFHGITGVESIGLPSASLRRSTAAFERTSTSAVATINYPAFAGAPPQATLQGEFEGVLVGDGPQPGAGVIGTWSLGTASTDVVLAGAFGAEYGDSPTPSRPVIDDSGVRALTFLGARPDSSGTLRLAGVDTAGNDIEFEVADLFANGRAVLEEPYFVDIARDGLETQQRVIDFWTSVDANTAERRNRLQEAWDTANRILSENVFGSHSRSRSLLGASFPSGTRNTPDVREARALLAEAIAAVTSPREFAISLSRGGLFEDLDRIVPDPDALFGVRQLDMRVHFGHTDYGRFGVWSKSFALSALDGEQLDTAHRPNGFSYSPLEASLYLDGDPGYPSGGIGTYEGATLAVGTGVGGDVYSGRIALTVEWGTRFSNARLHAAIEGLTSVDGGRPYVYNNSFVDQILIRDVELIQDGDGLQFGVRDPVTRVRFDSRRVETHWSGTREFYGKFVGRSIDGPLGMIGGWSLRSDFAESINGGFAADLAP